MKKEQVISKNLVIILVILAVILAAVAIFYQYSNSDLGKKISTNVLTTDSDGGKIGINIIPPVVEDKGMTNG